MAIMAIMDSKLFTKDWLIVNKYLSKYYIKIDGNYGRHR